METRTSVIGIVKHNGKILLLKRSLEKKALPENGNLFQVS